MGLRLEQLIATRTPAGRSRKIFRTILIALALALLAGRLRRGLLSSCHLQPLPFPVTPALRTPLLLPLRGRTIAPCRTPTPPDARRILAGLAAIPMQRMGWLEGPLTPLQQTNPRIPASARLKRTLRSGILRWAHGSCCSHRSSLGGELRLDSEAFLLGYRIQHSDRSEAEPGEELAAMMEGLPMAVCVGPGRS
jgi:hypothetical protein